MGGRAAGPGRTGRSVVTAWDYAAALYARPNVEGICLALQDIDGQCVPLLLWRLWATDEGRAVDDALLKRAVALARGWESVAVAPLRAVRRTLQAPFPPIPDAARATLRERVAAAELAAERVLLEALDALTPDPAGAEADGLAAFRDLASEWGSPASREGLLGLIQAASAKGPLEERDRSATP